MLAISFYIINFFTIIGFSFFSVSLIKCFFFFWKISLFLLFRSVKLYKILIALIIMYLIIIQWSLLRCVISLFGILFQLMFIQLIIKFDKYIYKFTEDINLIFYFYMILVMYNLVLNFLLESSLIYILENFIILSNITGVTDKLYNILSSRFGLVD